MGFWSNFWDLIGWRAAELLEAGTITTEEFEILKARALAP